MTRRDIAAWVERRLQALNAHDLNGLRGLYADDCAIESPTAGRLAKGARAAEDIDRAWTSGFPDVTFTTGALLIDGDRLAWAGTVGGTDRGEFMGLPATGKPFAVPMVLFTTLRDGRMVHERRVYDFTGMLMQIGVLKERPTGAVPVGARTNMPASAVPGGADLETPTDRARVEGLVQQHADAFARRDVGALAALHAADCVMDSHLAGRIEGPAAIADVYTRWFTALPDSTFECEDVILDGARAAALAVMTGTDRGGFLGFAPTGKPFRVRSAWLFTVRGGQFSHVHPIYDFTGILVQMGLLRPKPI